MLQIRDLKIVMASDLKVCKTDKPIGQNVYWGARHCLRRKNAGV